MLFCRCTNFQEFLYGSKYVFKRTLLVSSKNMQETNLQFLELSKKWFYGIENTTPVFLVNGADIQVLSHPEEFYKELLVR